LINGLSATGDRVLLGSLGGKGFEAKARNFIAEFGGLESEPYGKLRTAYTDAHGASDVDLKRMVNAFLVSRGAVPVEGLHLVRGEDEDVPAFVRRIHALVRASIETEFHPLLSVRALAAEFNARRKKTVWNSKGGHWVAVHGVGEITPDGLGFTLTFSDSISGKRLGGFVHVDAHRKARVPITFTVNENGDEDWTWIPGDKCLQVTAPGMPLGSVRATWHERTVIAARYLVHRESRRP
jgi:hypothetical protein